MNWPHANPRGSSPRCRRRGARANCSSTICATNAEQRRLRRGPRGREPARQSPYPFDGASSTTSRAQEIFRCMQRLSSLTVATIPGPSISRLNNTCPMRWQHSRHFGDRRAAPGDGRHANGHASLEGIRKSSLTREIAPAVQIPHSWVTWASTDFRGPAHLWENGHAASYNAHGNPPPHEVRDR